MSLAVSLVYSINSSTVMAQGVLSKEERTKVWSG